MQRTQRDKKTMERDLIAVLRLHGWKEEIDSAAFASKVFATIVAPKVASLYVQDFGPDEEDMLLTGTFYSGVFHNHLSPCIVAIPRNASDEQLASLATRFATEAEETISDTFSVRLLYAPKA